LIFLLFCWLGLSAYSQDTAPSINNPKDVRGNYWQQEVNYDINVRLDIYENTLDGFVKLQYINHSTDTIRFIWLHLWPNAYKNDETAFSDQLLENGRTDFYFSNPEQRGYINHLDFRINGIIAVIENHPEFIDIIKLILPQALAPGKDVQISTPFHEKLPFAFSGTGYNNHAYQITHWFPQPAVYDQTGWHPMPRLDQGGSYSEFGNFDVHITVPTNYVIATTGNLQDQDEKKLLDHFPRPPDAEIHQPLLIKKSRNSGLGHQQMMKLKEKANPDTALVTKTLHYIQENSTGFSWFASRNFMVDHDTIRLASGRIIDAYSYYTTKGQALWQNSLSFIKKAVRFYSDRLGEFPYNSVTAVETSTEPHSANAYPSISYLSSMTALSLDLSIEHSLGIYWLQNIIGPDGRRFPWMSEGVTAYYDFCYLKLQYPGFPMRLPAYSDMNLSRFFPSRWPENPDIPVVEELAKIKLDQPIMTASDSFSTTNYRFIAYSKTGMWMRQLKDSTGSIIFDSCMQAYFRIWKFKHPDPGDFEAIFNKVDEKKTSKQFALLYKTGFLTPEWRYKKIQPVFLFSARNPEKVDYMGIAPAAGYNLYDQLMVGMVIHNYNLPSNHLQFLLTPLFAIGSKQLNGIGRISYSWYPDHSIQKLELGIGGSRFSTMSGTDSNGNRIFGGFEKIVPFIRLTPKNKTPRSTIEKWMEFKIFGIGEKAFNYVVKSTDSTNVFPSAQKYVQRYLNQLTFHIEDYRKLYPYDVQLQFQQGSEFYRINLCSHYFFNYSAGGGMGVRFFAAKFGYIGESNSEKAFDTSPFQPKLTASRGYLNEDYTYSDYFIGRSEFTGFASQQIMMKDGSLKIRTDIFQDLQGRSDNWITAINFNTSLPTEILPKIIPLRIFLDIGTYAGAWTPNPPTSKFLYVSGLQLSLLKGLINIYAPLIYSSDFSNNLKTVPEENTFWKKVSFSIDIQDFDFKKK